MKIWGIAKDNDGERKRFSRAASKVMCDATRSKYDPKKSLEQELRQSKERDYETNREQTWTET